jgi:hypothetical protein
MSATKKSFAVPNRIERFGDFVTMTKSKRLPKIARDIFHDGNLLGYSVEEKSLLQLESDTIDDIKSKLNTPSWKTWSERLCTPDCGNLDFLDFEYAWYANVLLRTGYFENGIDPYRLQKWSRFSEDLAAAEDRFGKLSTLSAALHNALLGNQADLSQLDGPNGFDILAPASPSQIDMEQPLAIIADNFGRELLDDLILAIAFTSASGKPVHIHVKSLPLFVSDTTLVDFMSMLQVLRRSETPLARAICSQFDKGDLEVSAHEFWSSPLEFAMLPHDVRLRPNQTIIVKGDLNYRRAIGDAVVPASTPFEALPSLPPVPMLSLRSVKSYCLAGTSVPDPFNFPMDGTLFLAQTIPGREVTTSAPSEATPPTPRL